MITPFSVLKSAKLNVKVESRNGDVTVNVCGKKYKVTAFKYGQAKLERMKNKDGHLIKIQDFFGVSDLALANQEVNSALKLHALKGIRPQKYTPQVTRFEYVVTHSVGRRYVKAHPEFPPHESEHEKFYVADEFSYKEAIHQTHGSLAGKWMLFIKPENLQQAWEKITELVLNGKLGCADFYLSIFANEKRRAAADDDAHVMQWERANNNLHMYEKAHPGHSMVAVRVPNFADDDERNRVLKVLENSGLIGLNEDPDIKFKTDMATLARNYGENAWLTQASLSRQFKAPTIEIEQ
jgi:hypothetical protein